jgi:hypothetical protein
MNTYGKTVCPECGYSNNMFRPMEEIKQLPVWDEVKCWMCGHEYKHTERIACDNSCVINSIVGGDHAYCECHCHAGTLPAISPSRERIKI